MAAPVVVQLLRMPVSIFEKVRPNALLALNRTPAPDANCATVFSEQRRPSELNFGPTLVLAARVSKMDLAMGTALEQPCADVYSASVFIAQLCQC